MKHNSRDGKKTQRQTNKSGHIKSNLYKGNVCGDFSVEQRRENVRVSDVNVQKFPGQNITTHFSCRQSFRLSFSILKNYISCFLCLIAVAFVLCLLITSPE